MIPGGRDEQAIAGNIDCQMVESSGDSRKRNGAVQRKDGRCLRICKKAAGEEAQHNEFFHSIPTFVRD
jgi:hypothetical protein